MMTLLFFQISFYVQMVLKLGSWSSQDIREVLKTAACGAVDQGFKSPRARCKGVVV